MGPFLAAVGLSLSDIASAIYLVGALIVGVSAALFVIRNVRDLLGPSEHRFEGGRQPYDGSYWELEKSTKDFQEQPNDDDLYPYGPSGK